MPGTRWIRVHQRLSQPLNRLQTSVAVRYERGRDSAQWIENRDANGDGAIDHVYGTLFRNVVDVTVRGTYAFTPDLTLQAYLQPFVAAGDYRDIRRLARPRSYDFEPWLRWPTRLQPKVGARQHRPPLGVPPGQHAVRRLEPLAVDETRPGEFRVLRDIGSAFGASASHTFMVKFSYWLNR